MLLILIYINNKIIIYTYVKNIYIDFMSNNLYNAIWDNNYSFDMNYILQNYKCQVNFLINKNSKLSNIIHNLKKKHKFFSKFHNINWFYDYNYNLINIYINKLCNKLELNYTSITNIIQNISLIDYHNMMIHIKKKYKFYKIYNSGRYSSTFIMKHIFNNSNIIVKKTHIKSKKQLLNSSKELLIQYYVYHLTSLSPNIYFYYLFIRNNKLYSFFGMDRIRYVFYQLFDINKIYRCYKTKHKDILFQFVKALQIYIGALEKLILNGILHNDSHDGNFCFNSTGNICFIDFGEVKLIDKISNIIDNNTNTINYTLLTPELNYLYCHYLDNELDYFLDMYYFDTDYSDFDKDRYRILYLSKYSPIRAVHKSLQNNQYKFGFHLKYVTETIDIKFILNNINCKLQFKT